MPGDWSLLDGSGFVEDFIALPTHTGTHWDGLAHCFYDDRLYNGYDTASVTASAASTRLGIDQVAGGVAGRGVLLDVARAQAVPYLPIATVIRAADLDAAERRQRVRVGAGDVLLVRTGWRNLLGSGPRRARAAATLPPGLHLAPEPGLGQDVCEWLRDRDVAAVAMDNYAIEVIPSGTAATLPVHCILIRDMGMTLGELFDLEALAADCAADGIWQFFFTAPPLKLTNGVGSPINPIAIK
jgi:kynurenine formamidase